MTDRNHQPYVPSLPCVLPLQALLPYIPLTVRKDIMTLLRVGWMPRQNSRVRQRLIRMNKLSILQDNGTSTRLYTGSDILNLLEGFMQSPTLRGLLSVLVRCVPIRDKMDVESTKSASILKEVRCTQQLTRNASLCYPFLSSYNHAMEVPMHPQIPVRPFLAYRIRRQFEEWRDSLSNHFYIPQCNTKTTGVITTKNLTEAWDLHIDSTTYRRPATTVDLEIYYSETGRYVSGPCELRSAWKYNNLAPRIYYAIGGTCYFGARYTWHIFDSLQRAFSCSNPKTRFSFTRFPYINFSHHVFMIYDYTSFTSNLPDFKRFVDELAVFVRGVKARGFDTYTGVVEMDIERILEDYSRTCNQDGEFDMSQVVHLDDGTSRLILNHHVAGMLGVYGNITGSTALHGLVGMAISGNMDTVNTIGDDAAGYFDIDDMSLEETKDAIRIIGDIHDEKFEIWDHDQMDDEDGMGWHYTKRGINVEAGIVTQGWIPDFPIYPVCLGTEDDDHMKITRPTSDRRRITIRQVIRLFEALHRHDTYVSDLDVQCVLEYSRWLFRRHDLPLFGSFPSHYHRVRSGSISYPDEFLATPVLVEESIRNGWWATLLERGRSETGFIRVPVLEGADELPDKFTEGLSFIGRGSRVLGLLEKIGVVVKEPLFEERMISEESLSKFHDMLIGKGRTLCLYHVMKDYEPWESYKDLVSVV